MKVKFLSISMDGDLLGGSWSYQAIGKFLVDGDERIVCRDLSNHLPSGPGIRLFDYVEVVDGKFTTLGSGVGCSIDSVDRDSDWYYKLTVSFSDPDDHDEPWADCCFYIDARPCYSGNNGVKSNIEKEAERLERNRQILLSGEDR